ncbi:hypothetical protein GCM10022376_03280 [Yimella lutea]
MDHLTLQVAEIDLVVVDHGDRADAGSREVLQHRRAQTTCSDDEHPGVQQTALTGRADGRQGQMARVSAHLVVIENADRIHHL